MFRRLLATAAFGGSLLIASSQSQAQFAGVLVQPGLVHVQAGGMQVNVGGGGGVYVGNGYSNHVHVSGYGSYPNVGYYHTQPSYVVYPRPVYVAPVYAPVVRVAPARVYTARRLRYW